MGENGEGLSISGG